MTQFIPRIYNKIIIKILGYFWGVTEDKLLLKLTPQILKNVSSKTQQRGLIPKFKGPLEVIKNVGEVAYMLKLPKTLKLHPKFHVIFLKPYFEDAEP